MLMISTVMSFRDRQVGPGSDGGVIVMQEAWEWPAEFRRGGEYCSENLYYRLTSVSGLVQDTL